MTARDDTTRRGLLGGFVLIGGAAALPALPAAAATAAEVSPPAAWQAFLAAHSLLANQIGEVCVIAAKHGYLPEDIYCISLHNHECPAMAPALHFKQPNGDTDIVMTHGILVVYDRSRLGPRVL